MRHPFKKIRSWPAACLLACAVLLSLVWPAFSVYAEEGAGQPGRAEIQVSSQVTGDIPSREEVFTFRLTGRDGAPMPGDGESEEVTVTVRGEGTASFGEILYDIPGEYCYTVKQEPGENQAYTYDGRVYEVTVLARWVNEPGGEMETLITAEDQESGMKQTEISFSNRYSGPGTGEGSSPGAEGSGEGQPLTGDGNEMGFWAAWLGICALALVVFALRRKNALYTGKTE